MVTANASVNARDKALWSTNLSLGRIFALYLPLALPGAMTMGFRGITAVAVLANVLASWAAIVAALGTGSLRTANGMAMFTLKVLPHQP